MPPTPRRSNRLKANARLPVLPVDTQAEPSAPYNHLVSSPDSLNIAAALPFATPSTLSHIDPSLLALGTSNDVAKSRLPSASTIRGGSTSLSSNTTTAHASSPAALEMNLKLQTLKSWVWNYFYAIEADGKLRFKCNLFSKKDNNVKCKASYAMDRSGSTKSLVRHLEHDHGMTDPRAKSWVARAKEARENEVRCSLYFLMQPSYLIIIKSQIEQILWGVGCLINCRYNERSFSRFSCS